VTNFRLESLTTRMATKEDSHLQAFDHTALSAINTCPTWGIVRYVKHLRMPGVSRAMALEAGGAAHEAFGAVKWYQFHSRQVEDKCGADIAERHGVRLFGEDRFTEMRGTLSNTATDRTNLINFAISAVETSGFYDDISDNRRTISNISEALVSYIDRYDLDRYPVWVRDSTDPESDIGIEIAFDVIATITYEYDEEHTTRIRTVERRFTGKLDGLHINKLSLMVREEKTGARLDDSWLSQWILSHQITGYCVAASTFTGLPCLEALISGMRLPIGKVPAEGIRLEEVHRNPEMIGKWAEWFVHTTDMVEKYRDTPLEAPMYTHSCNRYFHTCSFLPLCACETRDEKEQVLDEMIVDEWSPLHD